MFEIFTHDYIVKALVSVIIISLTAPLLGMFVVSRRMSLIGDTLYGGKHDKIEGQCLQCYKLTFEHPVSKNTIEITTDYKQLNQWYDMI